MPRKVSDRERVIEYFASGDLAQVIIMLDTVKAIVRGRQRADTPERARVVRPRRVAAAAPVTE
jgi:hypothetical protein